MVIENLLRGLVPRIGGYTPVGASSAIISDPAEHVLSFGRGALLLLAYAVSAIAAGALLLVRRDVA